MLLRTGVKLFLSPYGVQRRMSPSDNRIEQLGNAMKVDVDPSRFTLLYVNHNDSSHQDRVGLKNIFRDQSWSNVDEKRVDYYNFLLNLANHKFILCPRGNAIDCHRNWEVLYMRRVPVMKRYEYLEILFKDYPVLWVNDYSEVTNDLLKENDHLYEEAQEMDLSALTLPTFFDKIITEYAGVNG